MNTALLNSVTNFIRNEATAKGINLEAEFGTREAFTKWVISFTIKQAMEATGMDIKQAYDFVLGAGSMDQLIDDCWAQVQSEK